MRGKASKVDQPRDNIAGTTTRVAKWRTMPQWFIWYVALALFYIATLTASLVLNYSGTRSFQNAIDSHELSAELLQRTSALRALALAVDAPGNDVFTSMDYINEAKRLDVSAQQFREALSEFRDFSRRALPSDQQQVIHEHIAAIESPMVQLLPEARQVFSFIARNDREVASQHMAKMDQHYSTISTAISLTEQMLQQGQRSALTRQHAAAKAIQRRGVWLLLAALAVIVASSLYGRRVIKEMRKEAQRRNRANRRLASARDQAEQASRVKSQFLANMSHEIRTPMNGVLGMLEAMKQTPLSPQQTHLLRIANASADILLSIIDDILDFSKIEAGMLVIERLPLNVHQIVQHVISLYNIKAHASQVQLSADIDDGIPGSVLGDPTRITQLLSNFVSNAIKFSENGTVAIRVTLVAEQSDAWRLRFAVIDSGIGISDEVQRKLFSAFTQADNTTSRRFGGTGLGLAICKQLVRMLDPDHGEIGVQSRVGSGSTFFFELTLGKTELAAKGSDRIGAPEASVERRFTARVLVAEDNETNQQVIATLLKSVGVEYVLAGNGLEALDLFANERFDLVVMDYHMPLLDGCGAARRIREIEAQHRLPRTPIIAVTASVLSEDRDLCTLSGMDDFLAKPIRRAGIIAIFDRWIGVKGAEAQDWKPAMQSATSFNHAIKPDDLLDREQYDEMRMVSADGFTALLEQFHKNAHEGLQAIRAAIETSDGAQLKRAAHKLKGTTGTLGARRLAALCVDLEMRGKDQHFEGAMTVAEQLCDEYSRFCDVIELLEQEHRLVKAS